MIGFDPTANINRVPCWTLRFFGESDGGTPDTDKPLLTVNHRSHFADISISLSGGLSAGRVEINLGRLIASDFEKLVLAQLTEPDGDSRRRATRPRSIFVAVQIYWKDPMKDALDFSDLDPIDVFRVTTLKREVAGLEVMTRFTGRRALYDRIAALNLPAGDGIIADDTLARAGVVLSAVGLREEVDFKIYDGPPGTEVEPNPQTMQPGLSVLSALADLRGQMIRRAPYRRGRSLYLIRNGMLHVGPYRPIPHDGATAIKQMDAARGLISVVENGVSTTLSASETAIGAVPEDRKNYTLHCAGRSDLQPGDVVSFAPPSETVGLFGGFGLPALPDVLGQGDTENVTLYVSAITHQFNTTVGWLTEASGVVVTGVPVGEAAWDVVQTRHGAPPATDDAGQPLTGEEAVGQAVGRRINDAIAAIPSSTIAEVRDHTLKTRVTTHVETAAQTLTLLRGFIDQGGPHQSRLDDIDRAGNDIQTNVPYATSFAWGPFGHVLPRYPGMRLLLVNNNSNANDPVDVGALWKTDTDAASAAPTNTEAGDWWLTLPAFENGPPPAASGTDAVGPDPETKATHDLITARGDRVIQVAGFTIRAITGSELTTPATRPELGADDGAILITQQDSGAEIRINADGSIAIISSAALTITTQDNVEIEAGGDLILTGNNIELNARSGGTVDAKNV